MVSIYKFGPEENIDICLSPMVAQSKLNNEQIIIIQLLAHAVLQIRFGTNKKKKQTITDNNVWTLKCVEVDKFYDYDIDLESNQAVRIEKEGNFTYCSYDLMFEGSLVFSMQEASNGYVLRRIAFNRMDDKCLDLFLDAALEHAERFGRRCL